MNSQPIRLRELRKEKSLTQRELAEHFNVTLDCLAGRSDRRERQ